MATLRKKKKSTRRTKKKGVRRVAKKKATKKKPAKKSTRVKRSQAKKTTVIKTKKNPAKSRYEREIQEAISRFTGFRGDAPQSIEQIELKQIDPVQLTMGRCLGIMYETVRDGEREQYLHEFEKSARPLLTVSSDGLQLYLIGGSYSVTDRGIEDA